MKEYTIQLHDKENGICTATINNVENLQRSAFLESTVRLYHLNQFGREFKTFKEYEDWLLQIEVPQGAIKEKIATAVNPSHYQEYFILSDQELPDLQWLEAMSRTAKFYSNPDMFLGGIELMIRGYLDRSGKKDNVAQELLKASWYLRYSAAYILNGKKPIRIEDIDNILKGVE